jgi:N-acetylglutamate synthase
MIPDGLIDATWPPAAVHQLGPWRIRDGQGGGSRVSAATATGPVAASELALMAEAMARLAQPALVMIRPGEDALDAQLAGAGYIIKDPVVIFAAPVAALVAGDVPPKTAFRSWPPLAVQAEIWGLGGIGPARLAVMHRVAGPKTSFLGRILDQPAGCAFVACHDQWAMLHALDVLPQFRRLGLGRALTMSAARWAQMQGAVTLSLLVTRANSQAVALYTSLGMGIVGQYHYRIKP